MIVPSHTLSRRQAVLTGLAALAGLSVGVPEAPIRAVLGAAGSARERGDRSAARALTAAARGFGFRLFGQLAAQQPAQSTFISPLSVSIALAMAYNGASGRTQQAMAAALGLQGMTLQQVNQANATLMATLLRPDPRVQVDVADSLWARRGITFKPRFIEAIKDFYEATATTLDFTDPGAAGTINAWVRARTHGKIDQIVPDRIDPAAVLFLINAIYFKGAWSAPFERALTRQQPFTLADGRTKGVPMMARSGQYPYYEDATMQAIGLPYGAGQVRMYVFLPNKGTSLSAFRTRMTAESWTSWMVRFKQAQGSIMLPRFTASYGAGLKDALTALGMGVAFDPQHADFGAMVAGPRAYLQEVQHKAVVAVDESGTTAAGATSVQVGITAVMAPEFSMVVDRPFFCAIADEATGAVLFMGAIMDPTGV